ncbi:hypothetical protein [Saccharopolyspora sp. NPDC050642]|uniref:hypothetical protein n=1 Tax=Saccharopolyspora sp. NPDC050642 TaxID=3157099 RepID=UPI0033FC9424
MVDVPIEGFRRYSRGEAEDLDATVAIAWPPTVVRGAPAVGQAGPRPCGGELRPVRAEVGAQNDVEVEDLDEVTGPYSSVEGSDRLPLACQIWIR